MLLNRKRVLPATSLFFTVLLSCNAICFANDELLSFEETSRIWHDRSNEHSINAALVTYGSRTLTLQTAEGKRIQISIDVLSPADQRYALRKIEAKRQTRRRRRIDNVPSQTLSEIEQTLIADVSTFDTMMPSSQLAIDGEPNDTENTLQWSCIHDALQSATKEGKPVLWFRVNGDLTGLM